LFNMNFFSIFLTFLKIGTFTIGGGYAMLPLIQREICEKKGWMNSEDFLDSISLTNSLPGPLVINAGTFIGYRLMGFLGSLAAILGCLAPSIVIITVISYIFDLVIGNPYVAAFFNGVRPAIVVIMLSAVIKLFKSAKLKNVQDIGILIISFVLITFLKVSSIWLVLAAAVIAVVIGMLKEREVKE